MPRLFIALDPPAPVLEALMTAMGGIANARWQRREQLHLTLSFLGDLGIERLADLDATLPSLHHASIPLSCRGVGHFASKGRVTTLWAAARPATSLSALATKVDHVVRRAGIIPQGLPFVPHITLARLNASAGPIESFLSGQSALTTPQVMVTHFGLYESRLRKDGAHYQCLRRYPLVE